MITFLFTFIAYFAYLFYRLTRKSIFSTCFSYSVD